MHVCQTPPIIEHAKICTYAKLTIFAFHNKQVGLAIASDT